MESKQQEIYLEQLIAGALTKFKELDVVDLHLLINDFRKKHKLYNYFRLENISKYVFLGNDGRICLNKNYSLNQKIETDCTLAEKFKSVAGDIVNNYISSLNLDVFYSKKNDNVKEQRRNVLNDANVLLVSSCEDDYNGLIKYGFKKVDYFKSYIRADKYFQEHFDELSKYQIILLGNNNVREYEVNTDLEERISFLTGYRDRVISYIHRSGNNAGVVLYDNESWRQYKVIGKHSFILIAKAIAENAVINNVLEVKNNIYDYSLIEDYINPDKLSLPAKKKDLKILCLIPYWTEELTKDISANLGLKITFAEDSNYGIARHAITNLGDYDIVIASELYSRKLLNLGEESTEQCKDTGRNLNLLLTYDSSFTGIKLKYVYGGNLAITDEVFNKEYKVLKSRAKDTSGKKDEIQSIIEQAVCIYNDVLIKSEKPNISDLDFKSIEDYEAEHQANLETLIIINNIIIKSKNYLYYKKQGLIKNKLDGLRIYENSNGICVENVLQGRTLCNIVFAKHYDKENIRVFSIQCVTKKGVLGNSELVGVYTDEFVELAETPKRPDEKQMVAIRGLNKKINHILSPIIELLKNEQKQERKLTKKEG